MLDDKYLNEIRARADAATAGPWRSRIEGRDHTSGSSFIQTGSGAGRGADIELTGATAADHDFIAHARQDIPNLIGELARLRPLTVQAEHAVNQASPDGMVRAGGTVVDRLPNGFHDAALLDLHFDLLGHAVDLLLNFWVGSMDAADEAGREATRRGVLRLRGVTSIQIEPPDPTYKSSTDGGVIVDGDFGAYPGTPAAPADGQVHLWFFVQTWNSRMLFTAASCDLNWAD